MLRKSFLLRLTAVFAAALLAGGLCACSNQEEESSSLPSQVEDLSVFPEGASIGGKNIAGKTVEEALETAKSAIQEAVDNLEITVRFRDDTILLSGEDFVTQDVLDLTLPQLLEKRLETDTPLNYVTDLSETGEQKLLSAAKDCVTQAQNATVSGRAEDGSFTFTDEQVGSQVDLDKTLESVRQLLSEKRGGDIQAAFVETQPTVTKAYLQEHFGKMSGYSTVSTNTANGNSNMALALSKVNGTILEPGEELRSARLSGRQHRPQQWLAPCRGHFRRGDCPDVWRRHLPRVLHAVHRLSVRRHGNCGALVPRHALLLLSHRLGRHGGLWQPGFPVPQSPGYAGLHCGLDVRHHPVCGVLRLLPGGVGQRGCLLRADKLLGTAGFCQLPHGRQPGLRPVCAPVLGQYRLYGQGLPQLL